MEDLQFEIKKDVDEFVTASDTNSICCTICNNFRCTCSLDQQRIDNNGNVGMKNNMPNHERLESVKKILIGCRICSKEIYKPLTYDSHWKLYHRNVNPSEMYDNGHQCTKCKRYFQHAISLKTHVRSTHERKEKKAEPHAKKTSSNDNRFCPICGAVFKGNSEFIKHLDRIHGGLRLPQKNDAEKVGSSINTTSLSLTSSPNKELFCTICGLVCSDEDSLTLHVLNECNKNQHNFPSFNMNNVQLNSLQNELLFDQSGCVSPNTLERARELAPNLSKTSADRLKNMHAYACLRNLVVEEKPDLVSTLQPFTLYPLIPNETIESSEFAYNETNQAQSISEEKYMIYNQDNQQIEFIGSSAADFFIGSDERQTNFSSTSKNVTAHHASEENPKDHLSEKPMQQMKNIEQNIRTDFSLQQFKEKRNVFRQEMRNRIICRICSQGFLKCRNYRKHFSSIHQEYRKDDMFDEYLKCNACHDVFQTLSGFKTHYVYQHKELFQLQGKQINYTEHKNVKSSVKEVSRQSSSSIGNGLTSRKVDSRNLTAIECITLAE